MADLVSHPDEVRVVSRRFGQGAANLDRYLELDGYKAVQKALAMEPDAIINEVKNSGLRGRGGAGFSTGMKWSFVPKQSAKPKYVLCNGDESEPGTCKDRLIFEHDPHSVIEGVMIGALAVGAKSGYIYIRGEYRYLLNIMQKAIADAYARGFVGKNIFGSGRDLDIYWHGGAGAYEVGEESALMESLEGKRGIPRIRPPFPAVVGLWGGPTVINNAETLANVPHIILGGADWYAKLGTPKNGGTRLFCLSGNIAKPGVYELPMGYNLKKMIYDVGGGIPNGRSLKAVVPGGASCPCLTADEIDVAMDFDSVAESRVDAGFRRRRRDRRPAMHREVRSAHHEVLPARKLRMVHPVPRRYGLAEENPNAFPRRRWTEEGHRQHAVPGGKHARANLLSAGRRRRDADYWVREEVQK